MSNTAILEVEFEAQGETLTLRNLPSHSTNTAGAREIMQIRSGGRSLLKSDQIRESETAGTVSLFAGQEKIGMLNWDASEPHRDGPFSWIPLSRNYKAVLEKVQANAARLGLMKLRISRRSKAQASSGRFGTTAGHLGFAGL